MPFRNSGKLLAACALLMCAPAIAVADEAPILSPVIVTATRFPDRADDKPVNLTVISSGDIARSTAKTVPDLLAQQAGIQIHDFYGNNAATTTVDLRGFGINGAQNTLILVDGRRVGDIDLSGVQWSAFPVADIERIEIIRGGGSVMYGDGAVGGVINIITKSPFVRDGKGRVYARAGSYATQEAGISAQHRTESFAIGASASQLESDGFRRNNRNRQANASADLRWLTSGGEVALKFATDHQGLRLPGARQVQPSTGTYLPETDRRGTPTPLDYAQRNGNRAQLDWRQRVGTAEFSLGAGWRNKEQTSYFDFSGFPDYRVVDLDVWSLSPRLRWVAGGIHSLVAGVDWYRWNYRLQRSNAATNITRPFNIVDAEQENLGFYVHDTMTLSPRLTVTAGGRLERYRAQATDRFNAAAPGGGFGSGAPAASQRDHEYAWELGARYAWMPRLAVIGKTARSFRYANVDEVYETSAAFTNQFQFLRPQTAMHHEVGMEHDTAGRRLRAALFQIDVKDEIHLDALTTGTGNTNLPPSRRRGLELEGRWQLATSWQISAAYTHTDARFSEGVLRGAAGTQTNVVITGKTVPLVPRHKFNAGAAWSVGQATTLSAALTHVGAQYMDNDQGNTLGVKIPAYTVADLKLQHRLRDWILSAAVNNLFDRKYYNYAVRSQFVRDRYNVYPLPERNLMMTAEYRFR